MYFFNSFIICVSILNFKINRLYSIYRKIQTIEEEKAGIDLVLLEFIFNIKIKMSNICFTVSSEFITGYNHFENQTNKSITSTSGNFDVNLSNSRSYANYSPNLQTNEDKIRGII